LKGGGKINEQQIQSKYEQLIKVQEAEIQKSTKQLIKDSLRISIKEMGMINYVHGHLQDSIIQWVKSLDLSNSPEDIFTMNYLLALCSFNF